MRVYRIVVKKWPTDDGRAWPRVVSNSYSHSPAYGPNDIEDDGMAWLRGLRDEDTLLQFEMNRDLNDEVIGWVLPATQRRHYISRTAAKKWCERAHTLGAECHFIESEPVAWTSIDNGAAK